MEDISLTVRCDIRLPVPEIWIFDGELSTLRLVASDPWLAPHCPSAQLMDPSQNLLCLILQVETGIGFYCNEHPSIGSFSGHGRQR